jgi:hypothetical protein
VSTVRIDSVVGTTVFGSLAFTIAESPGARNGQETTASASREERRANGPPKPAIDEDQAYA